MWIWYIVYGFTLFCALYLVLTNPYKNPYRLIMIFGRKGAGKSTLLTKLAIKHQSKGWTVYSTEPLPGSILIKPSDIGFIELPDFNYKPRNWDDYHGIVLFLMRIHDKFFPHLPKVCLLMDEVGSIWDNRQFKNFKPEVRDFFKLQRKRHIKCYLFSQTFDIDLKLRNLTDEMYFVRNVGRVFSYGKKIRKFFTIRKNGVDGSSDLSEGYDFEPFLFFFLGTRTLTFIPYWAQFFNSFSCPQLAIVDFEGTVFVHGKDDDAESLPEYNAGIELNDNSPPPDTEYAAASAADEGPDPD